MTLFPRLFVRVFCRALIAMLLFAQAAFATQPCVTPGMTAAVAMSAQSDDDCCGTSASAISLCVMRCTDSAKLSAHAPLPVPGAPPSTALKLPLPAHTALLPVRYVHDSRDPPKTIRFCSLLI